MLFLILCPVTAIPIFFIAFVRHGAVVPKKFADWDSKDRWGYTENEVTGEGLRQSYLIGKFFKEKYLETEGLLSGNPSEVSIYSANFNRTQLSAHALAYGLFEGQKLEVPKSISLPQKTIDVSKYSQLSLDPATAVPVIMDKYMVHGLLFPEDYCEEFSEYIDKRKSTAGLLDLYMKYTDVIEPIAKYYKVPFKKATGLFEGCFESVLTNNFHHFPPPSVFDEKWLKRAESLQLEKRIYLKYNSEYFVKFSGSKLIGVIRKMMEEKIDEDSYKKGIIYLTDDSTFQDILFGLKAYDGTYPGFGSVLIFQLDQNEKKKNKVRIFFNENEVFLPDKGEAVSFKKFYNYAENRVFGDNADACANIAFYDMAQDSSESELSYLKILFLNFTVMLAAIVLIKYLTKK